MTIQTATEALERDRRRLLAERDAVIYASTEPDPELDAWLTWAGEHPLSADD